MMERALPFVSVIIPVLNGERTIHGCLVSLLNVDYPPDLREILVVDNGSTDRTAEIVRNFPVRYLREERRGPAAARNKGIETSGGEILAFTDADCVVSIGWLRELVKGFQEESVAGVEGKIVAYPPVTAAERYAARIGSHSRLQRLSRPRPYFMLTANVAFRLKVFDRIGLFDPRFGALGGEDVDFSRRFFRESDYKLSYAGKAVAFHRHRATGWGLFTQRVRDGHARALVHKKYRQDDPWDWRREVLAYQRLIRTGWDTARSAVYCMFSGGQSMRFHDQALHFLARLGYRIGVARGILSRAPF